MKRIYGLLAFVLYSSQIVFGQSFVEKKGGICFRVDDNQQISSFQDYMKIFEKYNYHFSFSINLVKNPFSGYERNDSSYSNFLLKMTKYGHEYMDHSPDHNTVYITTDNKEELLKYGSLKGVNHISGNKICLQYDSAINVNSYKGEGLINIEGNKAISINNHEFDNFQNNSSTWIAIYIPALDKICIVVDQSNYNKSDQDTLFLKDFWYDDVDLGNLKNVAYHQLAYWDVRMKTEALEILGQRTHDLCLKYHLPFPTAWIQPGGRWPFIYRSDAKSAFGDKFNYKCAGTYPNNSMKCFNESDIVKDKAFGMQWGDFTEDFSTFKRVKSTIADGIAKHNVLVGHSHFGSLLGSWQAYLLRTDSLLNWCKNNDIPIRNYTEWADILYNSSTYPYENIMPNISTDKDSDGFPDGYYHNFGKVTSIMQDNGTKYMAFTNTSNNEVMRIQNLGGLEKGVNLFELDASSLKEDSILIEYYFNTSGDTVIKRRYYINSNENLTHYSLKITVPKKASYISINIYDKSKEPGNLNISNLSLRKVSDISISIPIQYIPITENSDSINLNNYLNNSLFPANKIHWTIKAKHIQARVDSVTSIISLQKPDYFWTGTDTITLIGLNPDGVIDTSNFNFISDYINLCKNSTFTISFRNFKQNIYKYTTNGALVVDSLNGSLKILATNNTSINFSLIDSNNKINNCSIKVNIIDGDVMRSSIIGPDKVCSYEKLSSYKITNDSIYNYNWELNPENSGILIRLNDHIEIQWNQMYYGNLLVEATLRSNCHSRTYNKLITKVIAPESDFQTSIDNLTVGFKNASTNAQNYRWNFDDSITSTKDNPNHVFKEVGIYNIKLDAYSQNCVSEKNKLVDLTKTNIPINAGKFNILDAYPNPCLSNKIYFKLDSFIGKNGSVYVINNLGEIIKQQKYFRINATEAMNVADLKNGFYTIVLEVWNSIYYGKVIITR